VTHPPGLPRSTRPWYWGLLAALIVPAMVALVQYGSLAHAIERNGADIQTLLVATRDQGAQIARLAEAVQTLKQTMCPLSACRSLESRMNSMERRIK